MEWASKTSLDLNGMVMSNLATTKRGEGHDSTKHRSVPAGDGGPQVGWSGSCGGFGVDLGGFV